MARSEVWVRTDNEIIRADAIRAVTRHSESIALAVPGEHFPLSVSLPRWGYRGEESVDFDNGADLDHDLLRAIAAAAKITGGAIICLGHDANLRTRWDIEPLIPAAPAAG